MAIRQVVQIGHPALRAENAAVTNFNDPKLKQVVSDLVDTMRDSGLIGMAAPQIVENYQVFVTEPRETNIRTKDQTDELRVYLNPAIVSRSADTVTLYEGCGSVANAKLFGPVIKPKIVTVEAFDIKGNKFRFTADGLLGRAIQHEYDHLMGILFLEKVIDYKKIITLEHYIERIQNDPYQIKTSEIHLKKFELLM